MSTLGCEIGRTDKRWIDFNFFGHQLTLHLIDEPANVAVNPVDGDQVPAFHFGVVLEWEEWHTLRTKLEMKKCTFLIEPHIRFEGEHAPTQKQLLPGLLHGAEDVIESDQTPSLNSQYPNTTQSSKTRCYEAFLFEDSE